MVGVAATGNYGFFNLLTCVFAAALLNDGQLRLASFLAPKMTLLATAAPSPLWILRDGLPCAGIAVALALYTAATLSVLHQILGTTPPTWSLRAWDWLRPLHLGGRYGLFASMTTTRDEVVIRELHRLPRELMQDSCLVRPAGDGCFWVELALPFKPGPLDRSPPLLMTHMPRLDWQLWFVSLEWARRGTVPQWFQRFLRLLRERQPDVVALVAHEGQSAAQAYSLAQRPLEVKVSFEDYQYSGGEEENPGWECGVWWCRKSSPSGSFLMRELM